MTIKTPKDPGRGRIELRPVKLEEGDERLAEVPSARPHYIRRVAANGEVEWTSEEYGTRSDARAAARTAQRRYWCPIHEFDAKGSLLKVLPGVRSR